MKWFYAPHNFVWDILFYFLCPSVVYYLRYAVRSFFIISRTIPHLGKRAGQKVQRKIAVAVQNVKPLHSLSRSFALSPQKSAELFYMFL